MDELLNEEEKFYIQKRTKEIGMHSLSEISSENLKNEINEFLKVAVESINYSTLKILNSVFEKLKRFKE